METEMITIGADRAMELLTMAVEERGADYVYRNPETGQTGMEGGQCLYVHTSPEGPAPGCIGGLALTLAGVPLATLALHENRSVKEVCERLIWDCLAVGSDAVRILQAAQSIQDRGHSWGTAWEEARGTYQRQTERPYVLVDLSAALAALPQPE